MQSHLYNLYEFYTWPVEGMQCLPAPVPNIRRLNVRTKQAARHCPRITEAGMLCEESYLLPSQLDCLWRWCM